jgi:hypothetical protein
MTSTLLDRDMPMGRPSPRGTGRRKSMEVRRNDRVTVALTGASAVATGESGKGRGGVHVHAADRRPAAHHLSALT